MRAQPRPAPTCSISGIVGTEMVYFAVGELELDGGVMVTASHNPKEYTGMKIVRRGRAAGRRRLRAAGYPRRAPWPSGARHEGQTPGQSSRTTSGRGTSNGCCRFIDVDA